MPLVYLGLGANQGRRRQALEQALSAVSGADLRVESTSSIYESAPLGPVRSQPHFYNAVARLSTTLAPRALLGRCLAVELALGRRRGIPQGPRAIDLDLLLYDELVVAWPELTLPHPELGRRAFVLWPLLELAPGLRDPRDGTPLLEKSRALVDQEVHVVRGSIRIAVQPSTAQSL